MYDLDQMLNRTGSRRHHQNMIRQAHREAFARKINPVAAPPRKSFAPLRTILATILNLITR